MTVVELRDTRESANLTLSGSAVCLCSKTEYRAEPADVRDERANKRMNMSEAYGIRRRRLLGVLPKMKKG